MLFYERSTCDTGQILREQQRQMSRGAHKIVIGGMGVRVKRTVEEVERSMVFNHFFVAVLRTFGEYCT